MAEAKKKAATAKPKAKTTPKAAKEAVKPAVKKMENPAPKKAAPAKAETKAVKAEKKVAPAPQRTKAAAEKAKARKEQSDLKKAPAKVEKAAVKKSAAKTSTKTAKAEKPTKKPSAAKKGAEKKAPKEKGERAVPYDVAAKKAIAKKAQGGEEVRELFYIKDTLKITASNALMRAFFPKMKLHEEKFLAYVMANIGVSDNGMPIFTGDIGKIARDVLGVNQSEFFDTLDEMAKKMLSASVTLNAMELNLVRDNKKAGKLKEAWTSIPLFVKFSVEKYADGSSRVICQLHPNLRAYLLNLTGKYTEILLAFVLKANSVYTVRLGRLLLSGHFKGNDEIRHQVFTMPELAKHLSLPQSYARTFSEFDRRALKRAVGEINQSSNELRVVDYGKTTSSAKDGDLSVWFDTQRIDDGEDGGSKGKAESGEKKVVVSKPKAKVEKKADAKKVEAKKPSAKKVAAKKK